MNDQDLSRIVFAGDRQISVEILEYILSQGIKPCALLVVDEAKASHAAHLKERCAYLAKDHILSGADFRSEKGINLIRQLKPDYILGIHFPYIVPAAVLEIPSQGMLNLHPAYLPYNRGWHTPSWAIWDDSPYGATLHFMDAGVDTGDIVHQRQLVISPADTADALYKKILNLEVEIFKEAWPDLLSGKYKRTKQSAQSGNLHKAGDLKAIQYVDLKQETTAEELIRQLRALTTNRVDEAAYFQVGSKVYYMQIKVTESIR